MKEHEENLEKIYEHFGFENQLVKLYEEIYELKYEIELDGLTRDCNETIRDEIADVIIVAYQLYLHDKKIRDRVKFKINRTLERIQFGYYEN